MYTSTMQCFCRQKGQDKNAIHEVTINGEVKKSAFCKLYFKDKDMSKMLGTSISFIIIGINIILKTVIIKLITAIRHDTYSERLSKITNGVFLAQFFNTGILLLLVNANMTEHSFAKFISTGKWYDYMPLWYTEVGNKIVKTMMINSITPYIGLCSEVMVPKVKKWLDKRKIDPELKKKQEEKKKKLKEKFDKETDPKKK